jgi:hypothetical protein
MTDKLTKNIEKFNKALDEENLGKIIGSFLRIERHILKDSGLTKTMRREVRLAYSRSLYSLFEGQDLGLDLPNDEVNTYFQDLKDFYLNKDLSVKDKNFIQTTMIAKIMGVTYY